MPFGYCALRGYFGEFDTGEALHSSANIPYVDGARRVRFYVSFAAFGRNELNKDRDSHQRQRPGQPSKAKTGTAIKGAHEWLRTIILAG